MPLLSKAIKDQGFAKAGSGGGNYLNPGSISPGDKTRITFLGDDSATGYECWADGPEGKRVKLTFADEPSRSDLEERAAEMKAKLPGDAVAKRFMAFAVWNYELDKIQVFQFNQTSLANPIINYLSDDEIEAETTLYDFVITKIKTGSEARDVRYEVGVMPGRRRKEDVNKVISAAWDAAVNEGFDITALTTGGDPFKGVPF